MMITSSSVFFHMLVRKIFSFRMSFRKSCYQWLMMGGKYLSVWWTLLLSIIQVLALGTCSTLAFQLGPMVRSIVDTWVIHFGCVLWTGNIMWDLLDMAQGNTHTYTPYMHGMIYTGVLGFFLQMQLLHLWSDPKKWEEFGLLRVCRVLSRLPSPRTRDKSIVAKFQQQNHLTD